MTICAPGGGAPRTIPVLGGVRVGPPKLEFRCEEENAPGIAGEPD